MTGKILLYGIFICMALSGIVSCSNTKYLPKGEALYLGASVKAAGATLKRQERKDLEAELEALTRPRPNRKFLGFMRLRLYAYNIAGNPKSETSLRGKLKYKFGEPPVVLSDVNFDKNNIILQNYLENRGYFQSTVTADTVVKRKKARAVYHAKVGTRYRIKEVAFEMDSSFLGNAIRNSAPLSILRPGRPYNLEVIKAERARIDAYLKENGFYYFNPEFLIADVDSTIGDNKVNLYVKLKPNLPANARRLYTINDIYIYTNYRLNAAATDDTSKRGAQLYKGYYVIDRNKQYKPKMFEQSMQFAKGDVYNRTDHNLSLNRLVTLGVFKFVKNRFEPVKDSGFSRLNTFYYLTPHPKKSIRFEVNGTSKSNNLVGSNVTLSWRNRNTFKAGELFTIGASGGAEVQYSAAQKGYNVYRVGLETSLTFPRFLIPFVQINTRGGFVPKTTIMLAYDLLNKQKQYTLNSFRATYGYAWKESTYKEHTLNPISINYVQPMSVSPEYQEKANDNPAFAKVIEKQFILGSTYNYTYNTQIDGQNTNAIYFGGTLDVSGNVAGLVTSGKPATIFNTVFSQYVKTEADFRVYRRLGRRSTWANRIIAGVGYPYGNSRELPYIKQFFIGGNNSIRAFRTRALGPGTFDGSIITGDSLVPDQSGDIKLELNTELRARLFSVVYGALFVDAGNIWLYRDNPNKPGAQFSKSFLKELAVGTGLGLRIDVSLLILRLDVAFPLRKPWLPDGERWVIDKIRFGSGTWRRENIVWNLAIGYPF